MHHDRQRIARYHQHIDAEVELEAVDQQRIAHVGLGDGTLLRHIAFDSVVETNGPGTADYSGGFAFCFTFTVPL